MIKVIVNSPEHKEFHNKEMYVIGEHHYKNSLDEDCIWYKLANYPGAHVADIYLGKNQVIDADSTSESGFL